MPRRDYYTVRAGDQHGKIISKVVVNKPKCHAFTCAQQKCSKCVRRESQQLEEGRNSGCQWEVLTDEIPEHCQSFLSDWQLKNATLINGRINVLFKCTCNVY